MIAFFDRASFAGPDLVGGAYGLHDLAALRIAEFCRSGLGAFRREPRPSSLARLTSRAKTFHTFCRATIEGSDLGCYFLGAADVASAAIALSAPIMV